MNRLWVQLALGFALVTIMAVVVVALLANRQANTQFRHYFAQSQLRDSGLEQPLAAHYAEHGGWEGVSQVFQSTHVPGTGRGAGRGHGMGTPNLILINTQGQVVYNGAPQDRTIHLSQQDLDNALVIRQQDQVLGYLMLVPGQSDLPPPAQSLLEQVNRALVEAGLIAGVLGVLLGLTIAWRIARPLNQLETAARHVARGDLQQRVPVAGTQELAGVAMAFNDMAAHLQQAEQLRRNLIADIAHELRTPLSVLQGNLQAILDDVYPLEKAEIATIYNETLMLHRLVNDLHELAQAEAGQLSLDLHPIQVEPIVTRIAALFDELAAQKQITLDVMLAHDLPPAQADPDRLMQMLHNLLANALRHTPEGGRIELRVAPEGPQTTDERLAPSTQGPAAIRFEVGDTGPGIADEDIPHVFERFWRADRSRSRGQGGSGLGMAITRQLTEAHGGTIGLNSQIGQGSRFWFTIPTVHKPSLPAHWRDV